MDPTRCFGKFGEYETLKFAKSGFVIVYTQGRTGDCRGGGSESSKANGTTDTSLKILVCYMILVPQ